MTSIAAQWPDTILPVDGDPQVGNGFGRVRLNPLRLLRRGDLPGFSVYGLVDANGATGPKGKSEWDG